MKLILNSFRFRLRTPILLSTQISTNQSTQPGVCVCVCAYCTGRASQRAGNSDARAAYLQTVTLNSKTKQKKRTQSNGFICHENRFPAPSKMLFVSCVCLFVWLGRPLLCRFACFALEFPFPSCLPGGGVLEQIAPNGLGTYGIRVGPAAFH